MLKNMKNCEKIYKNIRKTMRKCIQKYMKKYVLHAKRFGRKSLLSNPSYSRWGPGQKKTILASVGIMLMGDLIVVPPETLQTSQQYMVSRGLRGSSIGPLLCLEA